MPPSEPHELSDLARQLLLGPVDSFEKLELLLALHSAAGTPMTLVEIAARGCLTAEQVDPALAGLSAAGVIERTARDTWRIRDEFAAGVDDLAAAWAACRPAVLKAMTDRALGRIRASAARVFADAFRLRRRKEDGGDDDG